MPDTPKPKKFWLLPTLALIVIVGAWLVFRLAFPPFAPPVLPVPNGYDDLLRAAKQIAPRTGFYREMGAEELAAIVQQNASALELVREALQKECMVTVDWSPGQDGFNSHGGQGGAMRELARALAAAARQAKIEEKIEEAIGYGLESLKLAEATARGGLMIDRMVAAPVYMLGLMTLRNQVTGLTHDDCVKLREIIENSSLQLEPIDEVIRRDLAYIRKVNGMYISFIMRRTARDQAKETKDRMRESETRLEALEKLLLTHLALREFQLDKNQLPEQLSELVPNYLSEVPQDPFASALLVYRPEAESYQLYSVGTNKVDDQGVETQSGKLGDIILEPND